MVERKTTRLGTTATLKARKAEDHILLARGLSARLPGANTPLTALTQDEMERDLRHMEAFANACTTYAQQYYIYHNAKENDDNSNNDGSAGLGGGGGGPNSSFSASGKRGHGSHPAPLIAMPVRIDPEEEKRLQNLRRKIQHCEAQREVYEGQYLSLRAHYIYLSQQLKGKREDVTKRLTFLQDQVVKRGKLVALQRVRLQILRDTLQCLQYRRQHRLADDQHQQQQPGDLHAVWTDLEKEWKKAEEGLIPTPSGGIMNWPASSIPKIPPGVPLLLSQLADQPGQAAAWGTCGAFGAKPDSLVWIQNQVPSEPPDTAEQLPALREEVASLTREIQRERDLNAEFQSEVIASRRRNDELVAMMALLRTETEAVVARHNILLESDIGKHAAMELQEEVAHAASSSSSSLPPAAVTATSASADIDNAASSNSNLDEADVIAAGTTAAASVPDSSGLKEDDENDGDDEGGAEEEEDEGEILEDGDGQSKRPLEGDIGSPRSKRRKV